jgi:hypothetical protein
MITDSVVKNHLKTLVAEIEVFLEEMDKFMREPSTFKRGEAIGKLVTSLEIAKDSAARYGLGRKFEGEKLRKDKKKS